VRGYALPLATICRDLPGFSGVRRVVCAVDCGTVVNPDTVRAGTRVFGAQLSAVCPTHSPNAFAVPR